MKQTTEQTAHTEIPVSEWLGNKLIALTDNVAQALTSVRFLIALFLITVGTLGALYNQVYKVEVAVERLAVNFEHLEQRVDKLDVNLNDRIDKLEEKLDLHAHGQSEIES